MNIVQLKDGTGNEVYAVSHTDAIKVSGEQKTLTTKLANDTDIYNVTEHVPLDENEYYELSTAIGAVPSDIRKPGLVITYLNEDGIWKCYQYALEDTINASWINVSNWGPFGGASYATTSAEVAEMSDDLNIVKLRDDNDENAYVVSHSDAVKIKDGGVLTEEIQKLKEVRLNLSDKVKIDYFDSVENAYVKNKGDLQTLASLSNGKLYNVRIYNVTPGELYNIKNKWVTNSSARTFAVYSSDELIKENCIYCSEPTTYYTGETIYKIPENGTILAVSTYSVYAHKLDKYSNIIDVEHIKDVQSIMLEDIKEFVLNEYPYVINIDSTNGNKGTINFNSIFGHYPTFNNCVLQIYYDTSLIRDVVFTLNPSGWYPHTENGQPVLASEYYEGCGFARIDVTEEISLLELRLYTKEDSLDLRNSTVTIVKLPYSNPKLLEERINPLEEKVSDLEEYVSSNTGNIVVLDDETKSIQLPTAGAAPKAYWRANTYNNKNHEYDISKYLHLDPGTYDFYYDDLIVTSIALTVYSEQKELDPSATTVTDFYRIDGNNVFPEYLEGCGFTRMVFSLEQYIYEIRYYIPDEIIEDLVEQTLPAVVEKYNSMTPTAFDDRISSLEEIADDLINGGVGVPKVISNSRHKETLLLLSLLNMPTQNVKPLNILHFSDIHANTARLLDILDFKEYYSQYIDEVLHTGDNVYNRFDDNTFDDLANIEGFENVLNCIGNHDGRENASGQSTTWHERQGADCYNRYFLPFIENWGVTYTTGKCYYYKDYTAQNIRLIVLDENDFDNTDQSYNYDSHRNYGAQNTWLDGVLLDALTNHMHVIMASHSSKGNNTLIGDDTSVGTVWLKNKVLKPNGDPCSFSQIVNNDTYPSFLRGALSLFRYQYAADAVKTFINNGGIFICWLCGHSHYTDIGFTDGYLNQLLICVDTASNTVTEVDELVRVPDTNSENSFQIVSIDTIKGYITLLKVGSYYDKFLRNRFILCYDYINRRLVRDGDEAFTWS